MDFIVQNQPVFLASYGFDPLSDPVLPSDQLLLETSGADQQNRS